MKKLFQILFLFCLSPVIGQNPVLQVTFDDPDNPLQAVTGNALTLTGSHIRVAGTSSKDGAMQIKKGGYYATDLTGASGWSPKNCLNEWSLVLDIRLPEKSNGKGDYFALYQTNVSNSNDAECFVKSTGEIGVNTTGYCAHTLKRNEWYRVAIVMDCKTNKYAYYIDGVLVSSGSHKDISLDGRFSIEKKLLLFADNDGEDGDIDVSEISFYDTCLSDEKVKSLGGFGHAIIGKYLLVHPFLYDPSSTTATISWHDSDIVPHTIVYGTTSALGSSEKSSAKQIAPGYNWHTVCLSDLQPNTIYYYQIKGKAGDSEVFTFKTLPEEKDQKKLRFLIMGDSHGNSGKTAVVLDSAINKLKSLYGPNIHDCLDMILHTGDITDDGGTIGDYTRLLFIPFSVLSPHIPMLIVPGNHEKEHPYFYDYILNDRVSAQPEGHPDYKRYWKKRFKNVLFVGLNSYSTHFNAIAHERVPDLDKRQLAWLKETMDQAENDSDIDMVFCLVHECPVSELWEQGMGEHVSQQLYPLLRQYSKVQQISFGHTHGYERGVSLPVNDNAVRDMILLCDGNAGCYLDRWNKSGLVQVDRPEMSVTLDHWCFIIGEVDLENRSFTFDTYSLGNSDYKLHSEKVDHWYGKLDQAIPETPRNLSFKEHTNNRWTFSCAPFAGDGALYSTQFQLLKRKDNEETVILNTIRDIRNIYGITTDYIPVDKNQSVDILTLKTLLNNLDPAYKYFFRVRFRDDNRKWSNWAESDELTFATSLITASANNISVFNEKDVSVLHIVFPESKNGLLRIADINGKIMKQDTVNSGKYNWNYKGCPKGIYVVTIESGNSNYQAKVIIE
ncbi:MAG: metallophosphoesterase [Bacteroidales bacterium]